MARHKYGRRRLHLDVPIQPRIAIPIATGLALIVAII
jgi:hypothetical protein